MCRKRKMNMRVTKAEVIKTASDMADRNGLHNVSLKAIAENLGIRTPSLYNHIGSLDLLVFWNRAWKRHPCYRKQ